MLIALEIEIANVFYRRLGGRDEPAALETEGK
jgi:hypothetical protein